MQRPSSIGTAINTRRYKKWVQNFATYRTAPTRAALEEWIGQFGAADQDLAARVLDSVLFFNQAAIAQNFRAALSRIDGWNPAKTERKGRWFFVSLSSSSGESGDLMIREFRLANNLNHDSHKDMFIYPSQLLSVRLTAEDTVVLINDFSGSGDEICTAWNSVDLSYQELLAGAGRIFMIVIAATRKAADRVDNETDITLVPAHTLGDKDNIFHTACTHFSKNDKKILLKYNCKADSKNPKGYRECGLVVVFAHTCPNNTIPILHKDKSRWTSIFPRND